MPCGVLEGATGSIRAPQYLDLFSFLLSFFWVTTYLWMEQLLRYRQDFVWLRLFNLFQKALRSGRR